MLRNSAAVLSTGFAVRLLAFAAFLLISNALGAAQLGTFAVVLAAVEVGRQLTDFGLTPATVRRLGVAPRESWPGILASGLAIRLAAAAAGYLLLLASTLHPALTPMRPLFAGAGVVLFSGAVASGLSVPFQASLRMGALFRVHAAAALLYLAMALAGAAQGWTVGAFVAAYVVYDVVGAAGVLLLFLRHFRLERVRSPVEGRRLASDAIGMGLVAVISLLYFRLDLFMLEAMRGGEPVGHYALAFRMSDAFLLLSIAVSASAFPRFVALSGDLSDPRLHRTFGLLYRGSVALGSILALTVSLAAPPTLALLLPEYSETGVLLAVLVWSLVFVFANYQTVDLLMALGRTRTVAHIALLNLLVNVAGNLLLIPRYGALGAAAVTVLTEGTNAAMQAWYLDRRLGVRVPLRVWALPGVSAAILLAYHLGASPAALVPVAVVGAGYSVYRMRSSLPGTDGQLRLLRGIARSPL